MNFIQIISISFSFDQIWPIFSEFLIFCRLISRNPDVQNRYYIYIYIYIICTLWIKILCYMLENIYGLWINKFLYFFLPWKSFFFFRQEVWYCDREYITANISTNQIADILYVSENDVLLLCDTRRQICDVIYVEYPKIFFSADEKILNYGWIILRCSTNIIKVFGWYTTS